jgi:hypothetical protein
VLQQWLRHSWTLPPAETVSLEAAGSPGSFVGFQRHISWMDRMKCEQVKPSCMQAEVVPRPCIRKQAVPLQIVCPLRGEPHTSFDIQHCPW